MKNKLILLLAIAFGLAAALGTYKYITNLRENYRVDGNFAQIAVAVQKIPSKTQITAQMIEFKDIPGKYVSPGAIMDTKDAVGKLAVTDIYPGEQLLQNKLTGKNSPVGNLALKVKTGQRAVTVAVNDVSALAGLVSPGDRVDVLTTLDVQNESVTTTLFENIEVLAINQETDNTVNNNKTAKPQTATLLVTPEQAQSLVLATERGTIRLTLRTPSDNNMQPMPSARLRNLVY